MPDVQPQDTQDKAPPATLESIVGSGEALPGGIAGMVGTQGSVTDAVDQRNMAGLVSSLTSLQRQKVDTDKRIEAAGNSQDAKNAQIMKQAFAAEGVAAGQIPPPWDAGKEHAKYETNPIEGFGSAGGLFAMVASAFTKAPMENAINGMAGAITSIQNGNEAGYQRAFMSFKENVKLAEQRFKTQHELYEDAIQLRTTDAAASAAKMHNAAVRFGDQKMLFLLEHDMSQEIFELQQARSKSMEQASKTADEITLHTYRKAAVDAVIKGFKPSGDKAMDAVNLAAAVQLIYEPAQKYGGAEQAAVGKFMNDAVFHNKPVQEIVNGSREIHEDFAKNAPNREGYEDAYEKERKNYPDGMVPPERNAQLLQMFGLKTEPRANSGAAAGKPALTNARQIQQDAEAYKARMAAEHPDWGPDKLDKERDAYVKRREIETKSPTAADIHKDDVQYQKAERMEGAMTEMEELMLKHKLITGLGGTVTRPFEVASNILGSNVTDRKQFQRVATELKEWGTSVVNDRTGRPLSQETKDAAVIFAGLNPGDTGPNTLRAIMELRPVIAKIKEDILARGRGQGPVSGGGTPAPAAKTEKPGDQPWLKDPVKP